MGSNADHNKRATANAISVGILFGLSAGIVFGLAVFDNLVMGLLTGLGVGGVAGIALGTSRQRQDDSAEEH